MIEEKDSSNISEPSSLPKACGFLDDSRQCARQYSSTDWSDVGDEIIGFIGAYVPEPGSRMKAIMCVLK